MPSRSEEQLIRALARETAPLVGELRRRIDFWKPRREETIAALRQLAAECDVTYTRNNSIKLAGAGTSMLVTLGGAAITLATGGLALPFVAAGAALAIGGGVAVGAADYLNSTCSEEARERAQLTLNREKNAYEDVRMVIMELQHTIESTCIDNGWPPENGLAYLLCAKFKFSVNGFTIEAGKEVTRLLVTGLTAHALISDFKEVAAAAKAAANGSKAAAAGARKVAEAAKGAGNLRVVNSVTAAAKAAEDAATLASKTFITSKGAAEATRAAVEASEAAAKAAVEGSRAVAKSAAKITSRGTRAGGMFTRVAREGAKVAGDGAEAAGKAAKAVSKTGKILGKAVIVLNVVFFIMDAKDAIEAGIELAKGESKVGHHLRNKATQLEEELAYVGQLYSQLNT